MRYVIISPPPDPLLMPVTKTFTLPLAPPIVPGTNMLMNIWHASNGIDTAIKNVEAMMLEFGLKVNPRLIIIKGGVAVLILGGGDKYYFPTAGLLAIVLVPVIVEAICLAAVT